MELQQRSLSPAKYYNECTTLEILHIFARYPHPLYFCIFEVSINAWKSEVYLSIISFQFYFLLYSVSIAMWSLHFIANGSSPSILPCALISLSGSPWRWHLFFGFSIFLNVDGTSQLRFSQENWPDGVWTVPRPRIFTLAPNSPVKLRRLTTLFPFRQIIPKFFVCFDEATVW